MPYSPSVIFSCAGEAGDFSTAVCSASDGIIRQQYTAYAHVRQTPWRVTTESEDCKMNCCPRPRQASLKALIWEGDW